MDAVAAAGNGHSDAAFRFSVARRRRWSAAASNTTLERLVSRLEEDLGEKDLCATSVSFTVWLR